MKGHLKVALLAFGMLLLLGLASSQPATQQFGTKVQLVDPDLGLPLSLFSPIGSTGVPPPGSTAQNNVYLSYWDIGSTPGLFDRNDVVYLQFGSEIGFPGRIIRTNNIRMNGWGNYPAGSYVKAGDLDVGQQVLPWPPAAFFPAVPFTSYAYVEVDGILGYSPGDPVYIDIDVPPGTVSTNDIRVTPFAGFPAGSKVSNADSDAGSPLTAFYAPAPLATPFAGPSAPDPVPPGSVAQLSFFNTNGNSLAALPIYDDGDVVYFDVAPVGFVSPNDIRLF